MSVYEDLLVADFQQCFEQIRHYDESHKKTAEFVTTGFIAIVTAYVALVGSYGFKPLIAVACCVLTGASGTIGLLFLVWLARNRVYYVRVCRYVNEIRSAYVRHEPAETRNRTGMYTNPAFPAIVSPWSTQAIYVYFICICNALLVAAFVGTLANIQAANGHGLRPAIPWTPVLLAFSVHTALQMAGVLLYWTRKDKEKRSGHALEKSV